MENYLPIFYFLVVALLIGFTVLLLGRMLGPSNPNIEKSSPYECGFEAFNDARMPFNVRYYLVAVLFILFDIEAVLLFPWAILVRELGWGVFGVVFFFLFELMLGFFYLWKKGALDWH